MRTAAVVAVLLLLVSTVAWAEDDLEDQLDTTRDQLEDARGQQSNLRGQVTDAEAQLAAADARLVALEAQLADRQAELAAATAAWEEVASRANAVAEELREVSAALQATRDDLADKQDLFDARAVAAYKYGTSAAYAGGLLRTRDFSELVTTAYYLKSVMDYDRVLIEDVSSQAQSIARARGRVDKLYDALAVDEAAAERARTEVERATDVHRQLTEMVAEERANRARVLTQLESDLATYSQLVESLEAESQRLAAELAARQDSFRAGAPGKGELLWPTDGRVGSGYGYRTHPIYGTRRLHTGIDIGGPYGQEIVSAAEGRVISAGWRGGYGLAVVIDHGGGLATLYAHQSRVVVSEGEIVGAGQKVGEIGSTGQSTGPHLHFEVRVDGTPEDPMKWY